LSDFKNWKQKDRSEEWLLFPENLGKHLSIDEVDISGGELYTILTNKAAKGRKGALAAMVHGTKASDIAVVLAKIPLKQRTMVEEVTLDMSESMNAAIRQAFPKARRTTDRFHIQQLVSEAVQEIRICLRRQELKKENSALKQARENKQPYQPIIYKNGDTKKQLLSRSRHLLFKPSSKWTDQQKERAEILFSDYPELKEAYEISMLLRSFYEHSKTIIEAKERLDKWYGKVEEKNIESFNVAAESIHLHETTILNYFINRSTNASAESFNAKLKGFRSIVRGVRDKKFFLFRIAKLYG